MKWILAAGGDPSSPAATALLSHELGHKFDRRFLRVSMAWGMIVMVGIWASWVFSHSSVLLGCSLLVGALLLIPCFHLRELRADDVAADHAGVNAMVEWFRVAPAGAGPGFFHPSDAGRIHRQELRLGWSSDACGLDE
ncbi:hypothetical protein QM646_14365 [Rhodococcus erythropolis]|nr:hypothetical protein [Rhodococcus erythropolis]